LQLKILYNILFRVCYASGNNLLESTINCYKDSSKNRRCTSAIHSTHTANTMYTAKLREQPEVVCTLKVDKYDAGWANRFNVHTQ